MLEGLQESMTQFKGVVQGAKQVNVYALPPTRVLTSSQGPRPTPVPNQVEVTLITGQSPILVKEHLEKMVDQLQLEHLKKISVVCVSDPERMIAMVEPGGQEGSQPLPLMGSSPSELGVSCCLLWGGGGGGGGGM